jgi:thiosulfate/3-mercaptopyruvate sulfurtransferase
VTPQPVPGLVTAGWLADHLGDADLRVVDCRYVLGQPGAGLHRYREGHIPGATHLDVDADLAAPPGAPPRSGRHPLPDAEAFATAVRRAGVSRHSFVVACDDRLVEGGAARLWWLLRHHGHDAVTVLDGGLAAWTGPLEPGETVAEPGDWAPATRTDGTRDTVDRAEVLAGLGRPGRVLVDGRVPARFRGETEPVDPLPGRIPGAVNLPHDRAFPPPVDLVGTDDEVVVYCGSGITACTVVLALHAAGRAGPTRLYPGSYSEWLAHDLPVERGDPS